MSSGFNTDIKVGEQVFHVQTEDRGPAHPIIDTAVYQNGRILHRRAFNYSELSRSDSFTVEDLRFRVEEQHRAVIEDIRSGVLDTEIASASAATQSSRPGGIQLQLLNPGSWLSAGKVSPCPRFTSLPHKCLLNYIGQIFHRAGLAEHPRHLKPRPRSRA